jgi:predicted amidohydrolase YtcJ
MARAKRTVDLSGCRDMDELVGAVAAAASGLPSGAWLRGRGWWTEALDRARLGRLEDALNGHPALLASHDHHSAWASAAALREAGIQDATPDPEGGRFERRTNGSPDGVLRERAVDLVADQAPALTGLALDQALDDVIDELVALGVTCVTDAGDPSGEGGAGQFAALGESFPLLSDAADRVGRRIRANLNLPVDTIPQAAALGLRSGTALTADGHVRVGWAKLYTDGALGSRTAAVFEPYTCGDLAAPDRGILRVTPGELAEHVRRAREARIGMAIHAIGDRAVATAFDALESGSPSPDDVLPDRIEHAQLVRAVDRPNFAAQHVTASLQPIHLPSDRFAAEACWAGRLTDAYAWRSLADSRALLALGSDAPIETPDPWRGIFAAVRRHAIDDQQDPWRPHEALTFAEALAGYTIGPSRASLRPDLGHLRPGARADLAVLNVDLATLTAVDERLGSVHAELTLLDGREVHAA